VLNGATEELHGYSETPGEGHLLGRDRPGFSILILNSCGSASQERWTQQLSKLRTSRAVLDIKIALGANDMAWLLVTSRGTSIAQRICPIMRTGKETAT
jgi:hypothetical protein